MLYYSLVFLLVAIVAGALGFWGIAGIASTIAKVLFVIFLVLFIVSLLKGRRQNALELAGQLGQSNCLCRWPSKILEFKR